MRLELLDDEAPAGRRLERDLDFVIGEASSELPHAVAVGGRDPRARHLACLGVEPLRGDLRSVLVKSHYDRHSGASSSSTV
jgi:hypothetical protein